MSSLIMAVLKHKHKTNNLQDTCYSTYHNSFGLWIFNQTIWYYNNGNLEVMEALRLVPIIIDSLGTKLIRRYS